MNKEKIAEIAHNVERALRLTLNEPVKYTWKDETDEKKESIRNLVDIVEKNIDSNPGIVQNLMHENTLDGLCDKGYVFGQVEDSNIKTSPLMVRYKDLPLEQKAKIAVIYQVCYSLLGECK